MSTEPEPSPAAASAPAPLTPEERASLTTAGLFADDVDEAIQTEPAILAAFRAAPPEEAVALLKEHVMRIIYYGDGDDDDDGVGEADGAAELELDDEALRAAAAELAAAQAELAALTHEEVERGID